MVAVLIVKIRYEQCSDRWMGEVLTSATSVPLTQGWTPKDKEVSRELSPLSLLLGTWLSCEPPKPIRKLTSVLAPVH